MKNNENKMSFADTLLLIFVTLKLCHLIDWNWVWVLSPLWISLIVIGVIYLATKLND